MRLFVIGFILVGVIGEAAHAEVGKFPYEAVIESDELDVRSGPGRKYYPTMRLNRGDRVVVNRHDPGGWYVIFPPPGSFSWIRASDVKRVGGNRGVLIANNVVVRVGSLFGDTRDVEQIRLSTGDEVEILGEKTFESGFRPTRMYKIKPPKGEYRWIPGQLVTPMDEVVRRQQDRDLFDTPSQARHHIVYTRKARENPATQTKHPLNESKYSGQTPKLPRKPTEDEDGFVDRPPARITDNNAVHRSGPSIEQLEADRKRLNQLDVRFRTIINKDIGQWNFAQLDRDYLQLSKEASRPAFVSQIALRISALTRYREIKAEYGEFLRLTAETDRREAQLLSWQRKQQQQPKRVNTERPVAPKLAFSQAAVVSQGTPGTSPRRIGARRVARFDSAGIIQRAATTYPGAPRHVLVTPNGRVLAYLQAERGVNLDQHLGRAMGVYGKRWRRPDLQTDLIRVHNLTPVRLTP